VGVIIKTHHKNQNPYHIFRQKQLKTQNEMGLKIKREDNKKYFFMAGEWLEKGGDCYELS